MDGGWGRAVGLSRGLAGARREEGGTGGGGSAEVEAGAVVGAGGVDEAEGVKRRTVGDGPTAKAGRGVEGRDMAGGEGVWDDETGGEARAAKRKSQGGGEEGGI